MNVLIFALWGLLAAQVDAGSSASPRNTPLVDAEVAVIGDTVHVRYRVPQREGEHGPTTAGKYRHRDGSETDITDPNAIVYDEAHCRAYVARTRVPREGCGEYSRIVVGAERTRGGGGSGPDVTGFGQAFHAEDLLRFVEHRRAGSTVELQIVVAHGEANLRALALSPWERDVATAAEILGDVRYAPAFDALIELLDDESPHVRGAAVRALGAARCTEPKALAGLSAAMEDKQLRSVAAQSLTLLGRAALPSVLALMDHDDEAVRREIVRACDYRSAPELAVPALVQALMHQRDDVRLAALHCVHQRGAHDPALCQEFVPLLGKRLNDVARDAAPEAAARALARLGEHARPARYDVARAAVWHPRETVREAALEILERWAAPSEHEEFEE